MQPPLKGKKALVTGGGSRIGRAIALALAQEGADVGIHYWASEAGAQETIREITALGGKANLFRADFRVHDAVRSMAEEVKKAFPSLQILVNNASIYPEGRLLSLPQKPLWEEITEWEEAMAVNSRAPFFLTKYLKPLMLNGEESVVINMLDTSITEPFSSRAVHSVSKSTLAAVTRVMSHSLPAQVRVYGLELGAILPADNMAPEERAKRQWLGVEPVIDMLLCCVRGEVASGGIYRVV